jgi:hypothetical protein
LTSEFVVGFGFEDFDDDAPDGGESFKFDQPSQSKSESVDGFGFEGFKDAAAPGASGSIKFSGLIQCFQLTSEFVVGFGFEGFNGATGLGASESIKFSGLTQCFQLTPESVDGFGFEGFEDAGLSASGSFKFSRFIQFFNFTPAFIDGFGFVGFDGTGLGGDGAFAQCSQSKSGSAPVDAGPAFGCSTCSTWYPWVWPNSVCDAGLGGCNKLMSDSGSVDSPGFGFGNFGSGACAPVNPGSEPYSDDAGMSSGTSCNPPSPSYDWDHQSSDLDSASESPNTPFAEDAVDIGLDGSINRPGLAVDGAGFGAGACTTFVDPRSGPGAEFNDACASDKSTVLKYSSTTCSKSSSAPRFPNTVVTPSGMCITSTHA